MDCEQTFHKERARWEWKKEDFQKWKGREREKKNKWAMERGAMSDYRVEHIKPIRAVRFIPLPITWWRTRFYVALYFHTVHGCYLFKAQFQEGRTHFRLLKIFSTSGFANFTFCVVHDTQACVVTSLTTCQMRVWASVPALCHSTLSCVLFKIYFLVPVPASRGPGL